MKYKLTVLFLLSITVLPIGVHAQYGEPELQRVEQPKNLFDEGYRTGLGFIFGLNDFGFGAGVQLRKGLSPYTEALLNFQIAGLRDAREQTFIDFYLGGRTIPSKYRRVVTFPLSIGLKRRFFASEITDNFRFHSSMSVGPAFALTFPYFNDLNNNGFREANINLYEVYEPAYDIFTGWRNTETHLGLTGQLTLGIDFGDNFAKLQTFQFGYNFFFFDQGIQIMEPFEPVIDQNGNFVDNNNDGMIDLTDAYDRTRYFGSAQITFIFGWMWKK